MADNNSPNIVWGSPPPSSQPPPAAPQIVWGASPPSRGDLASTGAGVLSGLGSVALGTAQLGGKILPAPTLQPPTTGPMAGIDRFLSNPTQNAMNWLGSATQPYQQAHPELFGAGQIVGEVAPVALSGGELAPTVLGKIGRSVASGAASGLTEPVQQGQDYWSTKAKQVGVRAAEGPLSLLGIKSFDLATKGIANISGPVVHSIFQSMKPVEQRAAAEIFDSLKKQGIPIDDAIKKFKDAGPNAVPGDIPALQTISEGLLNQPGTAGQMARRFVEERSAETESRVTKAIQNLTGQVGDVHGTADELISSRDAASKPLYEKAFEGGSIAPLENMFEDYFNEASRVESETERNLTSAQNELTSAQAKATKTGGNVYSTGASNQDVRAAQIKVQRAQRERDAATQAKNNIVSRLQQAQADETTNAPGAVWSPRIQEFLSDPIMKQGLARGYQLERIAAVTEGRRFDPYEYAVTGTDSEGNPIIGQVPNMRVLDAGKRGLDTIIRENTDAFGNMNQLAREVNRFRVQFLRHIDEINPDYPIARAAYSGPSASLDAQDLGRRALDNDAEVTAKNVEKLPENDKKFFLNGVARSLLDLIKNNAMSANDAKTIFGKTALREKIEAASPDKEAFKRFEKTMTQEIDLAESARKQLAGSPTARRSGAMAGLGRTWHGAASVAQFLAGHNEGAAMSFAKAMQAEPNPEMMEALRKSLFTEEGASNFEQMLRSQLRQ